MLHMFKGCLMVGRTLPFSPRLDLGGRKKPLEPACIFVIVDVCRSEMLFCNQRMTRGRWWQPWGRERDDWRVLICLKWQRVLTWCFKSRPCCLPPREVQKTSLWFLAAPVPLLTFRLRHPLLVLQSHLPAGSSIPSVHRPLGQLHPSAPPLLGQLPVSSGVHSNKECSSLSGPQAFPTPRQAKEQDWSISCITGLGTVTTQFSVRGLSIHVMNSDNPTQKAGLEQINWQEGKRERGPEYGNKNCSSNRNICVQLWPQIIPWYRTSYTKVQPDI